MCRVLGSSVDADSSIICSIPRLLADFIRSVICSSDRTVLSLLSK